EGFAAHGVVSGAEGSANDHGDFRDNGIRYRVHHLRAGFDDAAPLGVAAHHESIYVVKENQGNQILIAIHDEARGLLGGLGVDDAAELGAFAAFVIGLLRVDFLIGDDADGKTADASVAADDRLAILGFVFIEAAAIEHARENFFHVIGAGGRGIVDAVNFFRGHGGFHGLSAVPGRLAAIAPFIDDGANAGDAGFVRALAEIEGAADGGVHDGTAQIFRRNFLSDGGL